MWYMFSSHLWFISRLWKTLVGFWLFTPVLEVNNQCYFLWLWMWVVLSTVTVGSLNAIVIAVIEVIVVLELKMAQIVRHFLGCVKVHRRSALLRSRWLPSISSFVLWLWVSCPYTWNEEVKHLFPLMTLGFWGSAVVNDDVLSDVLR